MLRGILGDCGRAAVAFSGGVDSTLLLAESRDALGADGVVAVTASAPFVPAGELEEARRIARLVGAEHVTVDAGSLMDDPGFTANPADRCYGCKKAILTKIVEAAAARGCDCVLEASNADDRGDYRPGARAVRELGVGSPLQAAGLTKAEIRELLRVRGLPNWDRPASPCLASRIPYGEEITAGKLRQVEEAETLLREAGFPVCRVRHHGPVARIEVPRDEIPRLLEPDTGDRLAAGLRLIGFIYVSVDLAGFRSGSLNEGIGDGGEEG
ncbi:MAG: ATP-dependent sacrificial sulfur transferase LarE [Candidatus Krumholzibacteriota bacterium]|nr:ATP-dependent sacrificial sulfur transferase LarE [Candidatus Krumholzibacteriota bacterium]